MRDTKTPGQLETEIAYFERILSTSRSADRVRRAERAIRRRRRLLADFMIPKAKKLLEALAEDCDPRNGDDHAWRKCRHCLGVAELEGRHGRALMAAVLRVLS